MGNDINYLPFSTIDLTDPFFDSLKTDYEGFNYWFAKKASSGAKAYVQYEDGKIQAFLYMKDKSGEEMNNIHHKVSKIMCDVSVFVSYAFADCIVLTKLFMNTPDMYEKSLLRGKLKVHMNESFKKLYGFIEKARKESYTAKLQEIIPHFHGPDREFAGILTDLEEISKRDSWWKEIRSAEVHLDLPILYESRHEEINESQVVMETMRLIPFFNRFNDLVSRMNQAHINYMFEHLSDKDKAAVLANSNL